MGESIVTGRRLWMGLGAPLEHADVAVLGVPYDGSVSHAPGAAQAPDRLRELCAEIGPWTETLHRLDGLRIHDTGDAAVDQKDDIKTQRAIRDTVASLDNAARVLLTLGGDHSITSGVVAGMAQHERLGILWFDAHADVMDQFKGIHGRNLSRWNHACPLRRICELPNVSTDEVLIVGARDLLPDEVAFLRETKLQTVHASELGRLSPATLADRIIAAFAGVPELYVSFDIDVLDPAYAPGTGVPIPGGPSTRYLYDLLQAVIQQNALPRIAGFDIVEVAPPTDVHNITALAARGIITHMLDLIATQRGVARDILDT